MLTLSTREQSAIASCSDTMLRPFDYPALDLWRSAVMSALARVIDSDVAFFNFRNPPHGVRVAFSREVSGASLDQYEQLCVDDAGFERAKVMRLTALNQTMLVAGDMTGYYADPFVNAFYLPHKLLDSACLILDNPSSELAASIELHSTRSGARAFETRGVAILKLLLPSFRAGLSAVHSSRCASSQMAELLNASASALRAFDASGRCVHQTPQVDAVLQDDAEHDHVLARMAQLARQALITASSAKSRCPHVTPLCATDVQTSSARYHVEATRVSAFLTPGVVILVALERLTPMPVAPSVLRARFQLTPREIRVAREIARGASTLEIATALAISVHTAKRHSEQVFVKLGVHSRSAVAAALFS